MFSTHPGARRRITRYAPDGRDRIKAQLRSDGLFLRMDLDAHTPRVTLLGFEDAFGRLLPSPSLTPAIADHLVAALDEQLGLLRR